MREALLEILREPGTGSELTLQATKGKNGRVEEGSLVAKSSGKSYPIVAGIPRFAPRENYTSSFGFQWNRFQETQIDAENGLALSKERFDAEAGWTAEAMEGKWVLDAGCGAGRFAEVAASRRPNLVALDYSSAVDAAAKTVARFDNVDLVQASLLEPPFAPGVFDFAYCIGVIQHTPDPKAVVANVASLVKPGGKFSMTIYARRPWTKLNAKYVIRPLTKRMPEKTLLKAIEASMPVMFPLTDLLFRLPLVGRVAQFTIPIANYVDTLSARDLRYRMAVLDTFDMLAPQFDDPMTAKEVTDVLHRVGVKSMEFRTRVPINVVGTR